MSEAAGGTRSIMRSRASRFAPISGLLISLMVLSRSDTSAALGLVCVTAFILSAFGIWWTWRVPVASFDGRVLTWRATPRSTVTIDTREVSTWQVNEALNTMDLGLRDGRSIALSLNPISPSDVQRLEGIFEFATSEQAR